MALLLKKRFLSSPWSFARTLELYEQAPVTGRQLQLDDEDGYYEEVLGSGQSDEEEGEADHPEFTALRHSKLGQQQAGAQQGLRSARHGDKPGHCRAHRMGPALRASARFPPRSADHVPRRDLPPGRPDGRTWTTAPISGGR